MELADIISIEEWAVIEEELYRLSGINVRVYDNKGQHITSHEGWANNLCPLIRSSREGLITICSVAQQNIAAQSRKRKAPIISECDAGLVKFVVPIFLREEFLGTLGGCGFRLAGMEIETSLLHEITNVNLEELIEVASGVASISEEKANELTSYFEERLNKALAHPELHKQF